MNTSDLSLPELSDERVAQLEADLFQRIRNERASQGIRSDSPVRSLPRRRIRVWPIVSAAAAVVVVAALAVPFVVQNENSGSAASSSASEELDAYAPQFGADESGDAASGEMAPAPDLAADDATSADRDVIVTASATLIVTDLTQAADAIGDAAVAAGGFVAEASVSATPSQSASDAAVSAPDVDYGPSGAWVTVRVPAAELTGLSENLSEFGEVTQRDVMRSDVTAVARDLEAREAALQASVDRLTELMAETGSVGELIEAETALSERQAQLESLQSELATLRTDVAMSTLTVMLQTEAPAVAADPAGFGDGIAAGWSGLIAALNGLVIGVGFVLPWLLPLAVVAGIVWAVRRARLARTASTRAASGDESGA